MATELQIATPSGKTIDIRLSTYCRRLSIEARLGAKEIRVGTSRLEARDGLPAGGTHALGPIVLDTANARKLQAAIDAYEAADPDIAAGKLREQRQSLVIDLASAEDAASDQRERPANGRLGDRNENRASNDCRRAMRNMRVRNFAGFKRQLDRLAEQNKSAYRAWSEDDDDTLLDRLRTMANDAANLTRQIEEMRDDVGRYAAARNA